ncbi:MAG: hypothetical protein H6707_14345 [Deltaproteobacteria bacterium]|nr:hypothetical protein [Deltaproteobacteria bacterium]
MIARRTVLSIVLCMAACKSHDTAVRVILTARLPLQADTLSLRLVDNGGLSAERTIDVSAGLFETGKDTTEVMLLTEGWSGSVNLNVDATLAGELLAVGQALLSVEPGSLVDAHLELVPADFPVNPRPAAAARVLASRGGGRQIASDGAGNFVAVWTEGSCQPSCAVYARLFGPNGTALSDELVVADGTDAHDTPTVAMAPDGSFVVAFARLTGTRGVYARPYSAQGTPIGAAQRIDSGAVAGLVPSILRLQGGYVVAWGTLSSTAVTVAARLLDDSANPNGADFAVDNAAVGPASSQTCDLRTVCPAGETCYLGRCDVPAPAPAIASIDGDEYVIIYNLGATLSARLHQGRGAVALPKVIEARTKRVGEHDVAAVSYGFVVVWSDALTNTSEPAEDGDGRGIFARRIALQNKSALVLLDQSAYTVNSQVVGEQLRPTIARTRDNVGHLLVAWAGLKATAAADADEIWGRRMLEAGLLLGADLPLNTTTLGVQTRPALAGRRALSFALLFEDASGLPMQNQSAGPNGVRGRLLFPDYDTQDGKIGARCGSCDTGLVCVQVQGEQRCVAACAGAGASCPQGGTCSEVVGAGHACLFPTR